MTYPEDALNELYLDFGFYSRFTLDKFSTNKLSRPAVKKTRRATSTRVFFVGTKMSTQYLKRVRVLFLLVKRVRVLFLLVKRVRGT
jgi:hypothetical protein